MTKSLELRDGGLALLIFLFASAVFTYPVVRDPWSANRLDSPDALLNAWIVSWNVHKLGDDPLAIYDANIFFPEKGALAYSENLITAGIAAAPFALLSDSPVFLFNVVLFLGFATTGFACFLLAFDVTGDRLASGLAGVLFAFAPFRFAHLPHLQLQLAFGIPLTLLFTRRILRGDGNGGLAAGVALALTLPLTFGSSVYYTVFAATAVPWVFVFGERSRRGALRLAMALGAGIVLMLPLVLPYLDKLRSGTSRSLDAARQFSATPSDYVSSFSHLHGFLAETPEPLFPGFVALGLAVVACTCACKQGRLRARPWLWITVAATGVVLSFGPSLGLFTLLHEVLPPYRALRVPSRAGVLFLLGVAILAAIGASRLERRSLRISLLLVACAECFAAPLSMARTLPPMPAIYESVQSLPPDGGALVELPMAAPERFQDNAVYVYRSAFHRRPLVNGYSGFVPPGYVEAFEDVMRGPLDDGLRKLARSGVRYLIAHEARLGPRMERELREARARGTLRLVAEVHEERDRLFEIVELSGDR